MDDDDDIYRQYNEVTVVCCHGVLIVRQALHLWALVCLSVSRK